MLNCFIIIIVIIVFTMVKIPFHRRFLSCSLLYIIYFHNVFQQVYHDRLLNYFINKSLSKHKKKKPKQLDINSRLKQTLSEETGHHYFIAEGVEGDLVDHRVFQGSSRGGSLL